MQKMTRPTGCETCASRNKGIFCDMEDASLSVISQSKVTNTYKKGQTIFFQGNPPFGLYCIGSGKIKVSKVGNDGKESIVRIAGPGDVLGHRSLFSKEIYTATATVIEDASICFFDKNYIYNAIKNDPSIALNLIEKLSKDMGAAEARNASMSQKSARERLAELFLTFQKNYGVEGEDGRWRLDIRLNRDEIASLVGTAHETIIRLISEFKDEGILEQEGKVIFIKDEEKLLEFANLDY
ncbi:MAG: Crp/Fnr family transcriptional regulator [Bacteriovoracia bacterium]